jgi:hypothetical protein
MPVPIDVGQFATRALAVLTNAEEVEKSFLNLGGGPEAFEFEATAPPESGPSAFAARLCTLHAPSYVIRPTQLECVSYSMSLTPGNAGARELGGYLQFVVAEVPVPQDAIEPVAC